LGGGKKKSNRERGGPPKQTDGMVIGEGGDRMKRLGAAQNVDIGTRSSSPKSRGEKVHQRRGKMSWSRGRGKAGRFGSRRREGKGRSRLCGSAVCGTAEKKRKASLLGEGEEPLMIGVQKE